MGATVGISSSGESDGDTDAAKSAAFLISHLIVPSFRIIDSFGNISFVASDP
jgi:hypothetical protein